MEGDTNNSVGMSFAQHINFIFVPFRIVPTPFNSGNQKHIFKSNYLFEISECTRTPKYFDFKIVYGCVKEAENPDCPLLAGFCHCILSLIRYLAHVLL